MSAGRNISPLGAHVDMDGVFESANWTRTPLGDHNQWPQQLCTVVGLLENSHRPMFVVWGSKETLIYNAAFAAMLGQSHPGALGQSLGDVFCKTEAVEACLSQIDDGESVDIELPLAPGSGTEKSDPSGFYCSCTPVTTDDGGTGFMATHIEPVPIWGGICPERRLRICETVMSSTEDFIYLIDPGGKFVYANQAILDFWELELSDVIGKDFFELDYPRELAERHTSQIEEVISTGKPLRAGNPFTDKSGETRDYEYIFTPVFDARGEVEAVAGITRDVTARRRREENARFLAEVDKNFSRFVGSEEIMEYVSRKLSEFLGASRVGFSRVYGKPERVRKLYEYRESNLKDASGEYRFSDFVDEQFVAELRAGRPVAVDNVATDPRTAEFVEGYEDYDTVAHLQVPYHSDGEWKFLLSVSHTQPHQWRHHEIELMRELTSKLWLRLERARADEALHASQQRLRRALSAAKMVVWEWDLEEEELVTFPRPDETDGLPFSLDFEDREVGYKLIHPDDIDRHRHSQQEALQTGKPYVSEYRIRPPDSHEWIWVEDTGQAVETPDGGLHLVGVVRDITERRSTEQRLAQVTAEAARRQRLHEAVMSSTPDLVYIFDLDYRFLYANRALLHMWGKSWDEAIGARLSELGYEPWHAEMHEREIDHVVATGEPIRGEVPFTGTSGRRIYDYLMVPVFDTDGNVEAVAGTTRDITNRKEAEEALRKADERKDRFLAVLSHELRNPLAPITLSLHLLDEVESESPVARKARESIERQVDQLTRLVDDLLDVTRITRDKIELRCEPLDLNEVVRHTVEDHISLFASEGIELQMELADEAIRVDGDANRLAQAIGNLLSNAAKFSEPGSHTRVITFCDPATDLATDLATVRVVDDGIGIEKVSLPTLFEPFAQADSSLEHSSGGLGLGLALVKGIVELHSGEVEVQSNGIGTGAEFTIRLPILDEERADPTSEESDSTTQELHILIIEDNVDVAQMLKMVLEMKGHQVLVAADGHRGLERVYEFRPDAVVCDIGLPGIDGYTIARSIREDPELEPPLLIALSGYARSEDIEKSKAAGFDYHLSKPPDVDELQELLATT